MSCIMCRCRCQYRCRSPVVPIPQQQAQVVDDGGGGESHDDARVVARVGDGVSRVAALHVVVVGVAV